MRWILLSTLGLAILAGCEGTQWGGPREEPERGKMAEVNKPVGDASIDATRRPGEPQADLVIPAGPPAQQPASR